MLNRGVWLAITPACKKKGLSKPVDTNRFPFAFSNQKNQASFLYWHVDGPPELRGELLRDVYGNYVVADSTMRKPKPTRS